MIWSHTVPRVCHNTFCWDAMYVNGKVQFCSLITWTLPFLSKTTNCRLTNSSFRPSLDKNKTYKLVFSFDYNVTVNHEIPILPVNHIGQFPTL